MQVAVATSNLSRKPVMVNGCEWVIWNTEREWEWKIQREMGKNLIGLVDRGRVDVVEPQTSLGEERLEDVVAFGGVFCGFENVCEAAVVVGNAWVAESHGVPDSMVFEVLGEGKEEDHGDVNTEDEEEEDGEVGHTASFRRSWFPTRCLRDEGDGNTE